MINTEKDYIQDIILFSLYSNIGREFVFKGGTCLYKIYKLNRFSEDLDFTLIKNIDIKNIFNKLIYDLKLLNINGNIKDIKEYKNEINVRLIFNGPLYRGRKEEQCFIPINISLKERVVIEPKKEMIIPIYKEIPNFEIFIMDEQEILAEKFRAILSREKPRDIYDLWFLLTKKNISPNMKIIDKKLSLYNLKFNLNKFIDSVEKKRGLWNLDLKNLIIGELPDFDEVKKEIISVINNPIRRKIISIIFENKKIKAEEIKKIINLNSKRKYSLANIIKHLNLLVKTKTIIKTKREYEINTSRIVFNIPFSWFKEE